MHSGGFTEKRAGYFKTAIVRHLSLVSVRFQRYRYFFTLPLLNSTFWLYFGNTGI